MKEGSMFQVEKRAYVMWERHKMTWGHLFEWIVREETRTDYGKGLAGRRPQPNFYERPYVLSQALNNYDSVLLLKY